MDNGSRILIIERTGEIREVLRTALERRGLQVYEAARADSGLDLAREHHPDLIVLDFDDQSADARELTAVFSNSPDTHETPLLLLGTARRGCSSANQFIAKPYHYQPLISKIEQLLKGANRRGPQQNAA